MKTETTIPSRTEIIDQYFLDARCKVIDLAAFFDRVDRHEGGDDFRLRALRACLPLLSSGRPDRARAVLEALSDPSTEPLDRAPMQGAFGAPPEPPPGLSANN